MRATERITGEKNGEPYRVKDLRPVKDKERASNNIRDIRESIEAETARILRDNDIIAEEKLAEDKLRAEECYRKKCAALERKLEKTEELKNLRDETLRMEKELHSRNDKPLQWNSGAILQITRSKLFVNTLLLLTMILLPATVAIHRDQLQRFTMSGPVGINQMEGISECGRHAPRRTTENHPA